MSSKKSSSSRISRQSHRSTLSLTRTEVIIHVYDLLPAGHLSSILWTIGTSLLHSGVVINGKEYAYGGHDNRGETGVYWTEPLIVHPSVTFRTEILHGFTFATQAEIGSIIHRASTEFDGSEYNILTHNCNHFTDYLCQKLTGRSGPAWLNRAASIGVALPCVVPRGFVEPPEFETVEGVLLEDDSDQDTHESSRMLRPEARRTLTGSSNSYDNELDEDPSSEQDRRRSNNTKGKNNSTTARDSSGRPLPVSERAPGS